MKKILFFLLLPLIFLGGCSSQNNHNKIFKTLNIGQHCSTPAQQDNNNFASTTVSTTSSSTNVNQPLVGNDRDIHGCISSAGYTWCANKQKCLRVWEEKCNQPNNSAKEKGDVFENIEISLND